MKKVLFLFVVALLISSNVLAQPERVGAGLSFATKKRFNGGDTGNPGLNVKTWIAVDKRRAFHIVPSVTAYNPLTINHTTHLTTSYLFHGDLDFQYRVLNDNSISVIAMLGGHFSYFNSTNNMLISIPVPPTDAVLMTYGPIGGAALEMRMSSHFDFILSAKYTYDGFGIGTGGAAPLVDPIHYPIIQVHAVYYFVGRGRGYSRR